MNKNQYPSYNAFAFNFINRFYKKYYNIRPTFVTLSQNIKLTFHSVLIQFVFSSIISFYHKKVCFFTNSHSRGVKNVSI